MNQMRMGWAFGHAGVGVLSKMKWIEGVQMETEVMEGAVEEKSSGVVSVARWCKIGVAFRVEEGKKIECVGTFHTHIQLTLFSKHIHFHRSVPLPLIRAFL